MGCGCVIALLAWISPRFVLFLMQLFTDRLALAFDSFVMGAAGFIFVPYATVVYALCYRPGTGVSGFGWVLVIVGLVLDIGSWGNAGRSSQQRQRG
jgi:hypothetical protein